MNFDNEMFFYFSSVSSIIYLSFQNSKSVVCDRGANQSSQMDGREKQYSTQHSKAEGRVLQKVPLEVREDERSELNHQHVMVSLENALAV